MAVVTGTITGGPYDGMTVTLSIPSVRIPELPSVVAPLQLADLIAVYDVSENKTSYQQLDGLRSLILTGGGGTPTPPVIVGNKVEIIVTLANIDGSDPDHPEIKDRVLLPELMGKIFTLRRNGYGDVLSTEWLNLPSGGFQLLEDTVRVGDVFIAEVFTPGTGTGGTTPPATNLINGVAVLVDDTPLTNVHRYKIIHPASTTKNIIVTLEDVADYPPNIIIPIETTLAGTWKTKIQTRGGQFIYVGNTSVTSLWLGLNEFLWLWRGNDGFYVLKASESIFKVGQPFMDYIHRFNSLPATGGLILRSAEPRLFALISANASMYVTEADWQADPLKRGKFSMGPTTGPNANLYFRMPDHQNQTYRGLNNVGGADTERPGNTAGILQLDGVGPHSHGYNTGSRSTDGWSGDNDVDNLGPSNVQTSTTGTGIGTETRGKNVGLIPYINS